MDISTETLADVDAIRAVHTEAFAPSPVEAKLVDDLRTDGALVTDLCLIATEGDNVIGHIAYSRATLDPSGHEILVLAPMAVLPKHQRQSVGTQLIGQSMRRAALTDFPLVSVLGHPEYYPRFGFVVSTTFGIHYPGVPKDAFMAAELVPGALAAAAGAVRYHPAFDDV